MKKFLHGLVASLLLVLLSATGVLAQQSTTVAANPQLAPPASFQMTGLTHIWQGWNNCGPATLTMALTHFGVAPDQYIAAQWLKPDHEDKNVSPWQMAEYVNTQLGGTVRALVRQGGSLELLKTLVSDDFPVLIESGYDPETDDQGWMGHYLLVKGYDDAQGVIFTYDSFLGPDHPYTYDHVNEFWRHFNRVYMVVYDQSRETELLALLGSDTTERQNYINALETARTEAVANPQDPYAWFNMGTNFVGLGMYTEAAVAYDQARNVGGGLPWRMMWYQFGPFEAYYHVGRYDDMIALSQSNLNDGGGQYVEETFYYAGLAREAMGETERAIDNYNQAVFFNPNFTPAVDARTRLQGA
jgi:hypothetical protein